MAFWDKKGGGTKEMETWKQDEKKASEPTFSPYKSGSAPAQKSGGVTATQTKDWQDKGITAPSSGGSSKSSSKKHDDGGKSDALKKQDKAEKERRKKMKKAYDNLYSSLRGNLEAQKGDVQAQRESAFGGLESDYTSAMTRAESGKQETSRYYDESEADMREEYGQQKKDRARIFQGRNITNSSYYIDAVTEADTAFNKTLSRMNENEARTILEQDTQISELGNQRMQKRQEIEMAYNQTMRQIEGDLTKTDFDRSNAMQQLEDEYNAKMGTISQQMLEIQQAQQSFRDSAGNFNVTGDTTGGEGRTNFDANAIAKQGGMTREEIMAQSKATGINITDDDMARLMSAGRGEGASQQAPSFAQQQPQVGQPQAPQQMVAPASDWTQYFGNNK